VGVYKSTDGGDSWAPVNAGIETSQVVALAVHPALSDIVYAATDEGLMKTVDGGTTWTRLLWSGDALNEIFPASVAIDAADPNTLYVAGGLFSAEVARSADGGATWTHLTSLADPVPWMPTSVAIDPARPDTVRIGTASAGVQQMNLQPDLAIDADPLAVDLPLGVPVPYSIEVRNLGHLRATGVTLSIQLPAGSADVVATPSTGTCSVVASGITCLVPQLIADTLTVTGSITPSTVGAFKITSSVSSDQVDVDSTDNMGAQSSSVSAHADLAVSLTGPAVGVAGASLQFGLTISNSGPSPASGVHATYTVPVGMTIDSFSSPTSGCSKTSTDTIACDITSLNSGSSAALTVTGTAATAGTYVLTSAVSGQVTDNVSANNTASLSATISASAGSGGGGGGGGSGGGASGGGGGGGGGGGNLSPLFLLGLLLPGIARARKTRYISASLPHRAVRTGVRHAEEWFASDHRRSAPVPRAERLAR
jgi:uncharacterized repeat protein (TIGR01451 family)